jgi:hypothetical protein
MRGAFHRKALHPAFRNSIGPLASAVIGRSQNVTASFNVIVRQRDRVPIWTPAANKLKQYRDEDV